MGSCSYVLTGTEQVRMENSVLKTVRVQLAKFSHANRNFSRVKKREFNESNIKRKMRYFDECLMNESE